MTFAQALVYAAAFADPKNSHNDHWRRLEAYGAVHHLRGTRDAVTPELVYAMLAEFRALNMLVTVPKKTTMNDDQVPAEWLDEMVAKVKQSGVARVATDVLAELRRVYRSHLTASQPSTTGEEPAIVCDLRASAAQNVGHDFGPKSVREILQLLDRRPAAELAAARPEPSAPCQHPSSERPSEYTEWCPACGAIKRGPDSEWCAPRLLGVER